MTIFQRLVLLLKVLVLLTLGTTTAWANSTVQSQAPGFVAAKHLQLAKSESEAGDKGQGGSEDGGSENPGGGGSDGDQGENPLG